MPADPDLLALRKLIRDQFNDEPNPFAIMLAAEAVQKHLVRALAEVRDYYERLAVGDHQREDELRAVIRRARDLHKLTEQCDCCDPEFIMECRDTFWACDICGPYYTEEGEVCVCATVRALDGSAD